MKFKYMYCGMRIYKDGIKLTQIISNFTFLHASVSAPQGNLYWLPSFPIRWRTIRKLNNSILRQLYSDVARL